MRIREAKPEDATALAALLAELGYLDERGRIGARVDRFAADPSSCFLVAEDDGRLVRLASASALPLAHQDGS